MKEPPPRYNRANYKRLFAGLEEFDLIQFNHALFNALIDFYYSQYESVFEPEQDEDWVVAQQWFFVDEIPDSLLLMFEECESPIEQLLGGYLLAQNDGYNEIKFCSGPIEPHIEGTSLFCQKNIKNYRVDFLAVVHYRDRTRYISIECDGHDYHERTKEQARRDRQRDRDLKQHGIEVIRFTGSEIHRDPLTCAEELAQQLARIAAELIEGWTPRLPQVD
jgi:very-short-patch-repair endonuclease